MLDGTERLAWTLLGIGAAFLLASCTTTPKIASDYDRSANFATYHTFTLMQREHRGLSNSLMAIRAEEDITQELQRRGSALATDPRSADLTVDFTLDSQTRTEIKSYPETYPGPGLLAGAYRGSNIEVRRQYREGTLAIDVFDGHTQRPVWHGWAQKELTRKDLEQPAEPISKAVRSVLAKFPPAGDSSCHQRGSECVS